MVLHPRRYRHVVTRLFAYNFVFVSEMCPYLKHRLDRFISLLQWIYMGQNTTDHIRIFSMFCRNHDSTGAVNTARTLSMSTVTATTKNLTDSTYHHEVPCTTHHPPYVYVTPGSTEGPNLPGLTTDNASWGRVRPPQQH